MEINQSILFEPFSDKKGMTSVGADADDFMEFIGFAVPDLGPPAAAATTRRAIIHPSTMCEKCYLKYDFN